MLKYIKFQDIHKTIAYLRMLCDVWWTPYIFDDMAFRLPMESSIFTPQLNIKLRLHWQQTKLIRCGEMDANSLSMLNLFE